MQHLRAPPVQVPRLPDGNGAVHDLARRSLRLAVSQGALTRHPRRRRAINTVAAATPRSASARSPLPSRGEASVTEHPPPEPPPLLGLPPTPPSPEVPP